MHYPLFHFLEHLEAQTLPKRSPITKRRWAYTDLTTSISYVNTCTTSTSSLGQVCGCTCERTHSEIRRESVYDYSRGIVATTIGRQCRDSYNPAPLVRRTASQDSRKCEETYQTECQQPERHNHKSRADRFDLESLTDGY